MEYGSDDRGRALYQTHAGRAHRLVMMTLLLCTAADAGSPDPAKATVYQCLDAAGKTVITNKQSGFRHCQTLSDETVPVPDPVPTPPVSGTMPQASTPAVNPDIPPLSPPLPTMPMVPPRPPDLQGGPMSSQPAIPTPSMPPSPSSPQPCSLGLNPLNPMSGPPCEPSNQSGTQPAGAPPVLSK